MTLVLNTPLFQSNGPFELLPVLGDFLNLAHLPQGIILWHFQEWTAD